MRFLALVCLLVLTAVVVLPADYPVWDAALSVTAAAADAAGSAWEAATRLGQDPVTALPVHERWAAVDAYALAATPDVERSLDALADYLDHAGDGTRHPKAARARAVYRWVTSRVAYDAEAADRPALVRAVLAPQDAASVLRRRSAVCEGYARLFAALATRAGVEAVVVTGTARSPGGPESPHAWNAVRLGSGWGLADPTWGAGGVDRRGRFVPQFSEEWFLMEPAMMAATHTPHRAAWSLR